MDILNKNLMGILDILKLDGHLNENQKFYNI